MAADMLQKSSLFTIKLKKCHHMEVEKSMLKNIEDLRTLEEFLESEHGVLLKNYIAQSVIKKKKTNPTYLPIFF